MKYDIVVTGAGGQGVRTAAAFLRAAAAKAGLESVQSAPYGHPQRGGAATVHVRIADHPIGQTMIDLGQADLILALEPLESLRYMELLSPAGTVITATEAVPNIPNYPPLDEILWSILRLPSGFLVDATRLARDAGGQRAANAALLGAAADFLPMEPEELRSAIESVIADKGQDVVQVNMAAFEAGRAALRHRELVDEFDTFSSICH